MIHLKKSKVFRGGVTSPYITYETSSVQAETPADGSVHVWTTIASKGGGDTCIKLVIAPDDLRQILVDRVRLGGFAAIAHLLRSLEEASDQLRQQLDAEIDRVAKQAEKDADAFDRKLDSIKSSGIDVLTRYHLRRSASTSQRQLSSTIRVVQRSLRPATSTQTKSKPASRRAK